VRETQNALFLNEGSLADIFVPGRYDLITQNIPLITKLKGWKYGFESPFKADVYFVNMRQFTGLKWGTPNPIIVRDPELKQVRIRAFGTYSIRVNSADLFFKEFGGTSPVVTIQQLEEQLRAVTVSKFTDAIGEANVSVYDLARNFNELGEKLLPLLTKEFSTLGIEIVNFYIQSTSLPPEVEQFLDKMTQMNMASDMNKFTQFQTAQSIPDLAKNPGGMGALGASFAMGNQLAQNLNTAQSAGTSKPEDKSQVMQLLKELAQLKEAGVLTEEEFNKKKTELLAKL
jgi:membrane protease subunit (stomatin/prohibitin family)